MKVLFVQKEGGIFGAENYQLSIIPALIAKGVDIEFLRLYTNHQSGQGGEFIRRLNQIGVKTYEVNIGKVPTLGILRKIHRVVKSGDYDIVHTHLIHADFYLSLVKLTFGLKPKFVSTKHGYDNDFTAKHGYDSSKHEVKPFYLISRWVELWTDASFTVSDGLRIFFEAIKMSKKGKLKRIHLGFDIPDLSSEKGNPDYRKADKQIIIAGRLVAFKGHKFIIEAMQIIRTKFDDVKLLIAGSGKLEEELRSTVKGQGLENDIEFLGYTKEVGQYMANSDVVVVPSVSEGFGVVFLEAFSAMTPVVAWNVPASNELIENRNTGYLVPPYKIDQFADQVIQVLENPSEQRQVVKNAQERLKSYYNLSRMVDETHQFYQKLY